MSLPNSKAQSLSLTDSLNDGDWQRVIELLIAGHPAQPDLLHLAVRVNSPEHVLSAILRHHPQLLIKEIEMPVVPAADVSSTVVDSPTPSPSALPSYLPAPTFQTPSVVAATATAVDPTNMVGKQVKAVGLQKRTDLNGTSGVVTSYDKAVDRYTVHFSAAPTRLATRWLGSLGGSWRPVWMGTNTWASLSSRHEEVQLKPGNLYFTDVQFVVMPSVVVPVAATAVDVTSMIGKQVQAFGMQMRTDLNGTSGVVISYEAAVGRHTVRFDAEELLVKPTNLKVLANMQMGPVSGDAPLGEVPMGVLVTA